MSDGMDELAIEQVELASVAMPVASEKRRDRSREDAGKSDRSWHKHDLISSIANAHGHRLAHGIKFKSGRGIIIDMHAGDGNGVEKPQASLFGSNPSRTTAELAVGLGSIVGADIVLCEKDAKKRAALEARGWQGVTVLDDHKHAPEYVTSRHAWALVLNDPNGPADHGLEYMQAIAERASVADFIIAFNEGGWRRVNGYAVKHGGAMANYSWMRDFREWGVALRRKQIAVSRLVNGSNGFQYRILVAGNHFDKPIRSPLFEVISCR